MSTRYDFISTKKIFYSLEETALTDALNLILMSLYKIKYRTVWMQLRDQTDLHEGQEYYYKACGTANAWNVKAQDSALRRQTASLIIKIYEKYYTPINQSINQFLWYPQGCIGPQ